jgi:hypothetical protein
MAPAVMLLVAMLAACSIVGDLRELQALSAALHKRYQDVGNININNGAVLTIMFQNSSYAALPDSERAAFARGVAEFAYASYPGREKLSTVNIGFANVKGAAGFSVTRTDVPYSWPAADLRGAMPDSTPTADSATAAPSSS